MFAALTFVSRVFEGGWSLVHIPGDGSTWSINSTQFVQEKMVQSPAFYAVEVKINDSNSSNYVLEVRFHSLVESGLIKIRYMYTVNCSLGSHQMKGTMSSTCLL